MSKAMRNILLQTLEKRLPKDKPVLSGQTIINLQVELSSDDLLLEIQHCIDLLLQLHIDEKNIIAVMLPQGIENAVLCLSVMSHAVLLPLNPQLSEDELSNIFQRLSVNTVIFHAACGDRVQKAIKSTHIRAFCVVTTQKTNKALIDLAAFSDTENITPQLLPEAINERASLILSTSGSTAAPKLVPLSVNNLLTSCQHLSNSLSLSEKDCCYNMLPLYHIGGLVDMLLAPLLSGGHVIIATDMQAHSLREAFELYPLTWIQAVPTMLQQIVSEFDNKDLTQSSLRFIRSVSAPLPLELHQRLEQLFNIPVVEIYGMTEAAGLITGNPTNILQRKIGSVGKIGQTQVVIINDKQETLAVSCVGQVAISGDNVMSGYLFADNQMYFTTIEGKRFFLTGDEGYLDEEGFLYLTGRLKDIINRGGEKISPQAIDDILLQHTWVEQAACFSLPHSSLGEDIAVAVVLHEKVKNKENTVELTKVLKKHLSEQVAGFKIPRTWFFVQTLPYTRGGKLQRHRLTEQFTPQRLSSVKNISGEQPQEQSKNDEEHLICQLWQEILAVDQVSPLDNFFDLGGDSLKAVTFIIQLEKVLKINSDALIANLYDYPTAREFADFLLSQKAKTPIETMHLPTWLSTVTLSQQTLKTLRNYLSAWQGERLFSGALMVGKNTTGNKPPIFWCTQSADEFSKFCACFDENQPIYGFRSLMKVEARGNRDYPGLAAYYVQELLMIQPSGNIILGGFCEGSNVAFEMTKQLADTGVDTILLCLQDRLINQSIEKKLRGKVIVFWSRTEYEHLPNKYMYYGGFSQPSLAAKKLYQESHVFYECAYTHSDMYLFPTIKHWVRDLTAEITKLQELSEQLSSPQQFSTELTIPQKYFNYRVSFNAPRFVRPNSIFPLAINLINTSNAVWQRTSTSGVSLGVRWTNYHGDDKGLVNYYHFDVPVAAGEAVNIDLSVLVPNRSPKLYQLEVGLVQEGIGWLSALGGNRAYRYVIITNLIN